MYKFKNIFGLSFLLLCVVFTAIADSNSTSESSSHTLIRTLEDVYINVVKTNHDEFKVTKLISKKDNKIQFLNFVFRTKIFETSTQAEHSDLLIMLPDANGPLHLSIVVVSFDSDEKTNEVFKLVRNKKQDYFDETKILTKYKIYKKLNNLIFVYSETFDAEPMNKVFNGISNYFLQK